MSSSNTKPRKHVSTLYRPLDTINQEIRLLRVGAGYDDEPVNCRLQHVKLDSIPRCAYETISYVWGNRRVRSTIYIEGRPLDVPASSARVLKAMRQGKRDRLLWIDAVCINQDDIQERNAQVAIMADIYANTSRTLVWLGESDSWTSTAVRTVGKILDDARGETKGFRDFDEIVFDRNADHWAHSTHALVGFAADKCLPSCLSSYFESAWFERIWGMCLVQCSLWASRNGRSVLHCGGDWRSKICVLTRSHFISDSRSCAVSRSRLLSGTSRGALVGCDQSGDMAHVQISPHHNDERNVQRRSTGTQLLASTGLCETRRPRPARHPLTNAGVQSIRTSRPNIRCPRSVSKA